MRRFALLLLVGGCDVLFPEFAGQPPADLAGPAGGDGATDAGGTPHLSGIVCALGDVRDLSSCSVVSASGWHVTVEETRDVAAVDAQGRFTLALSQALSSATVAAADPSGSYLPTVTTVHLPGGSVDGLALPLLAAAVVQEMALENGVPLDEQRGLLLGYAVDARGAPVTGAVAAPIANALGPFYEGATANQLEAGSGTRAHGLVALFDLPPPEVALTLGTPASAAVAGDRFSLPVRGGAVTFSLLVLPPRS
jgi:hypothetical protein